jgi:hypothetical protein
VASLAALFGTLTNGYCAQTHRGRDYLGDIDLGPQHMRWSMLDRTEN